MKVAASNISTHATQDTSTDIAMEVTNYMTMKCASSDTVWSSAAFQTVSYMLGKLQHQYMSKQCSQQNGLILILNDKRSVLASMIFEFYQLHFH